MVSGTGEDVGHGEPPDPRPRSRGCRAQARQVFADLERCLAAVGAGFGDVVKPTYFLTDVGHLPDARDAAFAGLPPPASSAVRVDALVRPELLREIETFALVPEERPEDGRAGLRPMR